jgi:adenine phosphoribosyltransferase
VVILDDLLATGGTMNAAVNLVRNVGGLCTGAACIIELSFLNGRQRLDIPVHSILAYDS